MISGLCTGHSTLASSPSIFVFELVSAGYFGDGISPGFRAEGQAMLDAVLRDLRRVPGLRVETISSAISDRDQLWESVASHSADLSLIIAPEFDGLLERFHGAAIRNGCRSLNCEMSAMRLCGDKWKLFQHLTTNRVATIPTELLPLTESPTVYPCVVKPRDGAGSWLVRTVADASSWRVLANEFQAAGREEYLCQPLITGQSLSVGALFDQDGRYEILPVAEQILSQDGEFHYLGGRIPARCSAECVAAIRRLIQGCFATIPGLRGYVGCDVIVPDLKPDEPLLVEINPRLTTSYIGYQRLCFDNLMEWMLSTGMPKRSLRWHAGGVEFDPLAGVSNPDGFSEITTTEE